MGRWGGKEKWIDGRTDWLLLLLLLKDDEIPTFFFFWMAYPGLIGHGAIIPVGKRVIFIKKKFLSLLLIINFSCSPATKYSYPFVDLSVNPLKKHPSLPPSLPHPSPLPPPPPPSHPFKSVAIFFFFSFTPPCFLTGNNLCTSFHPPHMAKSRTWRLFSRNTRKACPTLPLPDQTRTFKTSSFFLLILSFPVHSFVLIVNFSYF